MPFDAEYLHFLKYINHRTLLNQKDLVHILMNTGHFTCLATMLFKAFPFGMTGLNTKKYFEMREICHT